MQDMLLAILLWLGCISAPNTYTQPQIDVFATQNQVVINEVMSTPPKQEVIWQAYGPQVIYVEVIDPFK